MSATNLAGNRNSTPEGSNTLRPPATRQIGSGHHLRASADISVFNSPALAGRGIRPSSEVYFNQENFNQSQIADDLDKATQQWLTDIDQFEATLEEMTTATLDQDFKDELSAIEQWFRVLSEAERTSALYALLQQTTQVQIRFFIQVLQEMATNHPMSGILHPAHFGSTDSVPQKMTDPMGKLGVEGSRNSVGFARPPPSPGAKRLSGLDPAIISSMFPDAAAAIAKQKEQFTQQTGIAPPSTRNSIIGDRSSMIADRNSLMAPIVTAPAEEKKEVSTNLTTPWAQRTAEGSRPKSSPSQHPVPMGQFIQPPPSAGLRSPRPPQILSDTNLQNTSLNVPEAMALPLLSPYHGSGNWASMVNTPMVSTFNTHQSANQAEMVANATAMKLAALSTVNNRIQFDDVRKFRRKGADGHSVSPTPELPSNFVMTNEHGQLLTPQQVAALQARQLAAMNTSRSRPNSPGVFVSGAPNLSVVNLHAPQNNRFLSAYDGNPALSAGIGLGPLGVSLPFRSEGYLSDQGDSYPRGRALRGKRGTSRPPDDPTDLSLLQDVSAWLRSLRLHKYTDNLKDLKWEDLIEMDDAALEARGVAAVGARRKMLKVFEQVKDVKSDGKISN